MEEQRPRLPLHEWMAVIAILCLILSLLLVVLISGGPSSSEHLGPPHHTVSQEIEVFVEGAVINQGLHIVKRGATIQQVLELAVPAENADLKRIKPEKKVRNGQVIKIPTVKKKAKKRT